MALPAHSQVVTLRLNTHPEEATFIREFTQYLHININEPNGFFVRQISCSTQPLVVSVDQDDGQFAQPGALVTSYAINGSGMESYTIYSTLVNNTIGTITTGSTSSPNTYFQLNNNVNGNFSFRIDDAESPSVTADEIFTLVLEFVKY